MDYWNNIAKRYLKAELVRRGLNNADLVELLNKIGIEETKASIDSKISRGSFSASFFLQSLLAIGCVKIDIETFAQNNKLIEIRQGDLSNER